MPASGRENMLKDGRTFKIKKTKLVEDGYNLNRTNNDQIFYFENKEQTFKRLTNSIYNDILNKTIRF